MRDTVNRWLSLSCSHDRQRNEEEHGNNESIMVNLRQKRQRIFPINGCKTTAEESFEGKLIAPIDVT